MGQLDDRGRRDRSKFRAALTELAQLDKSDLEQALRTILTVDATQLEVSRVSFWELATDHSSIRCRVLYQRDAGTFHSGGELHAADFPAYFEAMLSTRTIVADDAWTDRRTKEFVDAYFRPNDIRSMLDVPVWRRGRLAGVICHEQVGRIRTWATDEQDFCAGIGNMVSVALEAVDRRRAEESYALVARATNDVLWDWDLVTNVVEWNDALFTVFGHRPEDVTPDYQWWLAHVHHDDREGVRISLDTLIASAASSWSHQYRWSRADGSFATVMDRGLIVRDDRGVALRMVGSMVDLTERVAMQTRLALSDRMASIGTLAAGVAHEINNPLTYIRANITCAIEELRGETIDLDGIVDLLREAQDGADRVRRIVRDLQVFSRPREDEAETFELGTVIESSLKIAWNEVRHRAQLVKDFGPTPCVRMNRARLGQVILNLVMNAAQAIAEGNVDRNQIHIRTSTSATGEAVIEVRDTGCGIPAAALGRVFEPFFTTKPMGVGTGLGLSICHSIVAAAGGRIDVESPPSGGCMVRLVLPSAPQVEPPARADPLVVERRRRVLLVDDEVAIRRVLQRMLEPAHDVVVADTGAIALEHVRGGAPYDAIFCDLMMPTMTGMELYERLTVESPAQAQRMIFMTGGAFSQRSSDFLVECNCPVVEKPFDRETITRALAQIAG